MSAADYIGVDTNNDTIKNGYGDGVAGEKKTNESIHRKKNSERETGNDTRWSDYPFILTDVVSHWPAFGKQSELQSSSLSPPSAWTIENFLKDNGDVTFRAEALDWPLRTYVEYMRNNQDESPLYLFDCRFVEKMGILKKDGSSDVMNSGKTVVDERKDGAVGLAADEDVTTAATPAMPPFWTPPCFADDLFDVWDADERPDWQWLIVGPARSGSTFHVDPNGTR